MSKTKKIFALLFSAVLSFTAVCSVFAEPETSSDTAAQTPASQDITYMENYSLEAPNTEKAGAALLVDMKTGRMLYAKNPDERMYPASTTKMMTGILALESGKMGETATATYEALKSITLEDSYMGILIGEQLSMTDLLYGMLVYSANDAANVIAVQIAGSMEAFVDMMNAKAAEIGMTNTHFMNPCGVHDDNHYTTAYDLAVLARYCMQNEQFREVVKTPSYHIAPTNKYAVDRYLYSTNLFLSTARSSHYLYKQCTGIKTGTTSAAGHCLVASAEYNGMELLSVVLKCNDLDLAENAYSYIVTRNLFDFGFNNYQPGILATPGNIVSDSKVYEAKADKRVTLTVDNEVSALLPIDEDIAASVETVTDLPEVIQAPVAKGDVLGQVSYTYNGNEIGRANLIAANDVELNKVLHVFHIVLKVVTNPLVYIPVVILIIIAFIARSRKRRRDRRRKLQQLKQRRESMQHEDNTPMRTATNSEINRSRSKGGNSRYSSVDKRHKYY